MAKLPIYSCNFKYLATGFSDFISAVSVSVESKPIPTESTTSGDYSSSFIYVLI